MNITSLNIKNSIIEKAKELGFEKIGFARYEVLDKESEKLKRWLDLGYDADMEWIEKGYEKRRDIRNILPDAKSIISLAYNYYTPFEHDDLKPKISRYAWGKDYHKVLKKKLKELIQTIEALPLDKGEWSKTEGVWSAGANPTGKEIAPRYAGASPRKAGLAMLYYVDDGPVMDKAWAVKAGIGWQGKHTNVINPEFGSWFFICNIITKIELDSYDSPALDQCGSCTLCISACPTGAITDEYVVDSNKCISYQTIENRGEIPDEINLNGWLFGCDICQDVCPYNLPKYNRITHDENFYPIEELKTSPYPLLTKEGKKEAKTGGVWKTKGELSAITEEQFNSIFADSPVKRTKYKGWKRNLDRILSP